MRYLIAILEADYDGASQWFSDEGLAVDIFSFPAYVEGTLPHCWAVVEMTADQATAAAARFVEVSELGDADYHGAIRAWRPKVGSPVLQP